MTKFSWVCGALTGAFLATTVSIGEAYAQAKVTKQFVIINGTKYRRNGAEDAYLGSVGLRRDVGKNAFERQAEAPKALFKIKSPTTVDIDFKNTASADLGVSYQGVGVEASFEQMKQGKLKLVKFEVDNRRDYVAATNKNHAWLDTIRDVDKDGKLRVVTSIWVLISGEEFNSFKASGNINYSGNGVTAKVGASGGSEAKFSFSKDTIIAYGIDRIDWQGKPKTRVIDNLTEDKVGGN